MFTTAANPPRAERVSFAIRYTLDTPLITFNGYGSWRLLKAITVSILTSHTLPPSVISSL